MLQENLLTLKFNSFVDERNNLIKHAETEFSLNETAHRDAPEDLLRIKKEYEAKVKDLKTKIEIKQVSVTFLSSIK